MPKKYGYKKKRVGRKRGNNKQYRSRIPRTIQIATRRPMSAFLKFTKNLVYKVNPGGDSTTIGENTYLTIRANSIYNILQQDGGVQSTGTWFPQDPAYAPGQVVNAEGYNQWKDRFQHFCVLGSQIKANFIPLNQDNETHREQEEATVYITLAGATGVVNNTTDMKDINKMPYLRKATVRAGVQGIGKGASLIHNYSAKKFEGIKSVVDNSTMKGQFDNSYASASQPNERSYFNVGICRTVPQNVVPPRGMLRIQINYIVKLTEPTISNQVSVNPNHPNLKM